MSDRNVKKKNCQILIKKYQRICSDDTREDVSNSSSQRSRSGPGSVCGGGEGLSLRGGEGTVFQN